MSTKRIDIGAAAADSVDYGGFVSQVGVLNYGAGAVIIGFGAQPASQPDDGTGKYVPAGAYRVVRNDDRAGAARTVWVWALADTSVELETTAEID